MISREGLMAGMSNLAPQQNQQMAQSLGSQSSIQQKQQAGGAFALTGQTMGKPQAQQAATQQAAQKGQANLAAAQSTVQQQGQLGQMALSHQAQMNQSQVQERQLGLQKKQRELENSLASLGENAKKEIFDSNMQFQKDELGRTRLNEQQLMDWKITQMKNANELAAFKQQVAQMSARKMQYLRTLHAKLSQKIEQNAKAEMGEQDRATQERILRLKLSTETSMMNEQRDAQRRMQKFVAAGTIIGTIAGGQAGGSIGGAVGSIAASTNVDSAAGGIFG